VYPVVSEGRGDSPEERYLNMARVFSAMRYELSVTSREGVNGAYLRYPRLDIVN
jgi:hypothetical protein